MGTFLERTFPRSIFKKLFELALPIIGLNVLGVMSLAIDTAMCGRLPNAEAALEALGFATQVVFLLMVAMLGLVVGTVATVARAHGAENPERVNHVLHQSTLLTVFVSAAVAVLANLFAPGILRLLGAREVVVGLGLDYLRPLLTGTIFLYLTMLYAAVLRGVGNTRLAFLVALVSNGANVLFNYGLILGNFGLPSLGVQGAAIGTVASNAVGLVVLIHLIRSGGVEGIELRFSWAKPDVELAKELFRVGAPAALDLIILNAGFASIVSMLGRLDSVAVAAHGVGLRIQALAFMPGLAVSQATGAMVGNALGAEDVPEAKGVVRASIALCVLIMSTTAIALIWQADFIVGLFDVPEGTALFEHSITWMRLLGYGMPIVGVNIAFVGMLRGAGATSLSLGMNLVSTVLVQIPLSYILGVSMGLGPWGVWAGFPLSFVVKMLLGVVVYRRGSWAKTGEMM